MSGGTRARDWIADDPYRVVTAAARSLRQLYSMIW